VPPFVARFLSRHLLPEHAAVETIQRRHDVLLDIAGTDRTGHSAPQSGKQATLRSTAVTNRGG
jgi:hypothetical protein